MFRFSRHLQGLNLDTLQHHIDNNTINPYRKITLQEIYEAQCVGKKIKRGVKLLARVCFCPHSGTSKNSSILLVKILRKISTIKISIISFAVPFISVSLSVLYIMTLEIFRGQKAFTHPTCNLRFQIVHQQQEMQLKSWEEK